MEFGQALVPLISSKTDQATRHSGIRLIVTVLIAVICLPSSAEPGATIPDVFFERVPDQGIQPQLITDNAGLTHLIYFKRDKQEGRNRNGNLYYRQRLTANSWSKAVKVSQEPFNHLGPVSKASAYVDNQGRIHVVWFISQTGYLYARSNIERSEFEPSRRVVTEFTEGLDAEANISGTNDRIAITWHAGPLANESARSVYSLSSLDNGATFGRAVRMSDPSLGACACCSLTTQYDENQSLQIAYRSAVNNDGRHMQFITREQGKEVFTTRTVGEWNINTCPVSSNHLNGDWLVFETQGQLFQINLALSDIATRLVDSDVRQKHPVIATNNLGQRLVAWGEANGYFSGGSLAVKLYDPDETIAAQSIRTAGKVIDEFSVAAASALPDNNFLVLY
jgi:hypothetical protein